MKVHIYQEPAIVPVPIPVPNTYWEPAPTSIKWQPAPIPAPPIYWEPTTKTKPIPEPINWESDQGRRGLGRWDLNQGGLTGWLIDWLIDWLVFWFNDTSIMVGLKLDNCYRSLVFCLPDIIYMGLKVPYATSSRSLIVGPSFSPFL